MDQDARRKGVFVEFLGAPAACHTGVVKLAIRSGKPLIAGVLVDGGSGTYRLVRGPVWRADPSRSDEENELDGTTVFHRFLEEQVRAHPGNYLWAHRRWKTAPPAGATGPAA
jgi:KDO2-lipid IV(A) lauroyltransferase